MTKSKYETTNDIFCFLALLIYSPIKMYAQRRTNAISRETGKHTVRMYPETLNYNNSPTPEPIKSIEESDLR